MCDCPDFGYLVGLKQTRHLAFVFLFYDLLRVLEDDDPRLRFGAPNELPQTDFMVREAALFCRYHGSAPTSFKAI
jgi:hypothetical protein